MKHPTGSKESGKKRGIFSRFMLGVLRFIPRAIYCTKYDGFEKIPDEGAVLLIANHVSYMDGMLVHSATKNRTVRFIVEKEIYEAPIIRSILKLNDSIPIEPNREVIKRALESVKEGLDNGDIICIFPEGKITYTGNLNRFKSGIEWMLEHSPSVPVIPIAITGMWGSIFSRKHLGKKFAWLPRSLFRKVGLKCGDIIAPQEASVGKMQHAMMKLVNEASDENNR